MCSYVTNTTAIVGSGYARSEWIDVRTAVIAFDHPQDLGCEHALCIDFRSEGGDPAARVAVELDPDSARRLAQTILTTLGPASTEAVAGGFHEG